MYRKKLSKSASKRYFRHTSGTHKLNVKPLRSRGGIRL